MALGIQKMKHDMRDNHRGPQTRILCNLRDALFVVLGGNPDLGIRAGVGKSYPAFREQCRLLKLAWERAIFNCMACVYRLKYPLPKQAGLMTAIQDFKAGVPQDWRADGEQSWISEMKCLGCMG